MIARILALLFLFFALCASASVLPRTGGGGTSCSTGHVQCCNSIQAANAPAVGTIASLLGIVLHPITGQVGLTCNPIGVLGVGGNSCNAQAACCTGNSFNGAIVLGCSPINLGL